MAKFELAFEKMIENEGGYKLHKVEGDKGGLTYAGISQVYNPTWEGWKNIDNKSENELTPMVKTFYNNIFWNPINGEKINSQKIANSLFDFAVNAGVRNAVKILQRIIGVKDDGIVGPITLRAINKSTKDGENMLSHVYTLNKLSYYNAICNHDKTMVKFLFGWTNRSFRML